MQVPALADTPVLKHLAVLIFDGPSCSMAFLAQLHARNICQVWPPLRAACVRLAMDISMQRGARQAGTVPQTNEQVRLGPCQALAWDPPRRGMQGMRTTLTGWTE
jgi:hypothetical protein